METLRNLLAAMMPSATKIARTTSCAPGTAVLSASGQGFKRGHFLEGLYDPDEAIEIERDHRAHDVRGSPRARHVERVARQKIAIVSATSERIATMRWQKVLDWKQEAGSAGQYRGHEKQQGPAIQAYRSAVEHDDETRANPIRLSNTCTKVNLKAHARTMTYSFHGKRSIEVDSDDSGMGPSVNSGHP
jgi:hypothetical protein